MLKLVVVLWQSEFKHWFVDLGIIFLFFHYPRWWVSSNALFDVLIQRKLHLTHFQSLLYKDQLETALLLLCCVANY
jgi:hypothetical protein